MDAIPRHVLVRSCPYLNNIVEQNYRAIKRRCASMLGFQLFGNAAITLANIELAHGIHKRQFSFGPGRRWRTQYSSSFGTKLLFQLDTEISAAESHAFWCRQCTRTLDFIAINRPALRTPRAR